jgi:circadian clock protein KaiA
MTKADHKSFLGQLKLEYREILINYFNNDKNLQAKIDKFINAAFRANISVAQILEIHMELIDEFSTQLKLEGRSEEVLLDYRLTLIDILAHLCEAYRRSLPK